MCRFLTGSDRMRARIGYVNWARKPTRTGVRHIGGLARRKVVYLELEWTKGDRIGRIMGARSDRLGDAGLGSEVNSLED